MSEIIKIEKTGENGTRNMYVVSVFADVLVEAPAEMSEEEVYDTVIQEINTKLELPDESRLSVMDVQIADFFGIQPF